LWPARLTFGGTTAEAKEEANQKSKSKNQRGEIRRRRGRLLFFGFAPGAGDGLRQHRDELAFLVQQRRQPAVKGKNEIKNQKAKIKNEKC
jgi:hypothetical protein